MQSFTNYSWLHFACVGLIVLLVALAIRLRQRRDPEPVPAGPIEKAIGYAFIVFWIGGFLWLRFGPLYDPPTTYPLQMCHLVGLAAAVVLVTAHPLLRPVAYFCGLGLCTQAIITPFLPEGPARFAFWMFWLTHGMILAVPIYDIAARGYRPGWRDFRIACIAAIGYVMLVLPIDLVTGWNYGFVGPSMPDAPTIVDLLGPWPQRLVYIVAIAAGAMYALYLPWRFLRPAVTAGRSPS